MSCIQVHGHQEIMANLFRSIENKILNPSLLFSGPSSIGKKKAAVAVAQALLCSHSPRPCGNCLSCQQVEKNQHASILFIEPQGLNIKIEVISKIRSFISLQSFSFYRIVIIDQAHLMNHQTQNALLKSLEEPPHGVHFILLCDQLAQLLLTIRSRTQCIRFQRLNIQDMKRISPDEKEWMLKASRGQLNRVHQWKEEEQLYQDIFQFWLNLLSGKKISTSLGTRLKERKTALLVARTFQEILRDIRITQENSKDWIHTGKTELYNKYTDIPRSLIDQLYQQALQLEKDISSYLDSRLCFENYRNQAFTKIQNVSHAYVD